MRKQKKKPSDKLKILKMIVDILAGIAAIIKVIQEIVKG